MSDKIAALGSSDWLDILSELRNTRWKRPADETSNVTGHTDTGKK